MQQLQQEQILNDSSLKSALAVIVGNATITARADFIEE